jgi:hypothetical protein
VLPHGPQEQLDALVQVVRLLVRLWSIL